jgi:hypothetical protein
MVPTSAEKLFGRASLSGADEEELEDYDEAEDGYGSELKELREVTIPPGINLRCTGRFRSHPLEHATHASLPLRPPRDAA